MAILVIGANGGIGRAVVDQALLMDETVYAVSRTAITRQHPKLHSFCGGDDEQSINAVIAELSPHRGSFTRVVITLGVLHQQSDPSVYPEKRLEDINTEQWQHSFFVNTLLPSLWVAKLLPLVKAAVPCVIAVLSARVGSIADNRLGGWYSYRSSKAALNMALKTAAIEYQRRAPNVKLVAFHPGTTDTPLSEPFQANVAAQKLFTPAFVAQQLFGIIETLQPDGELSYLDWQGDVVAW